MITPLPKGYEILADLVDIQPVYNLLAIALSEKGVYPTEIKAFARYKLEETVKILSRTANHVQSRLKEEE